MMKTNYFKYVLVFLSMFTIQNITYAQDEDSNHSDPYEQENDDYNLAEVLVVGCSSCGFSDEDYERLDDYAGHQAVYEVPDYYKEDSDNGGNDVISVSGSGNSVNSYNGSSEIDPDATITITNSGEIRLVIEKIIKEGRSATIKVTVPITPKTASGSFSIFGANGGIATLTFSGETIKNGKYVYSRVTIKVIEAGGGFDHHVKTDIGLGSIYEIKTVEEEPLDEEEKEPTIVGTFEGGKEEDIVEETPKYVSKATKFSKTGPCIIEANGFIRAEARLDIGNPIDLRGGDMDHIAKSGRIFLPEFGMVGTYSLSHYQATLETKTVAVPMSTSGGLVIGSSTGTYYPHDPLSYLSMSVNLNVNGYSAVSDLKINICKDYQEDLIANYLSPSEIGVGTTTDILTIRTCDLAKKAGESTDLDVNITLPYSHVPEVGATGTSGMIYGDDGEVIAIYVYDEGESVNNGDGTRTYEMLTIKNITDLPEDECLEFDLEVVVDADDKPYVAVGPQDGYKDWYKDVDGDGFHSIVISAVEKPEGVIWKSSTSGDDCDDGDANLTDECCTAEDENCVEENICEQITGYSWTGNFSSIVTLGENTQIKTDNFRDEGGARIDRVNCEQGQIPAGSSVQILDTNPTMIKRVTGTVNGVTQYADNASPYYKIQYEDCPKGNKPGVPGYNANKPCSDCFKGNPLLNMEIQQTNKNKLNGTYTGGLFGEKARNNGKKGHWGYDLKGNVGDKVFAAHAGKVVKVVNDHPDDAKDQAKYHNAKGSFSWGKYIADRSGKDTDGDGKNDDINKSGNRVYIQFVGDDGKTYQDWYFHLEKDSQTFKLGDNINVGEQIGTLGITGNAQSAGNGGPHVHYQVWDVKLGKAADPVNFLFAKINSTTGKDTNPCH